MINQIFKIAGVAAAAVAAWYTDKYVKEKTGKHIHEHALDYAQKLWARLKNWASKYLAEHERVRKVYLSAVSIAAAANRALDAGVKHVRLKIFGQLADKPTPIIIREEDVDLSQMDGILRQAKNEPVLAMRN